MDEEEWRARLVQGVAQQVRRYRLERGISVQKLADICTEEYGLPIKRSVLANFEGGRRPALSVVELLVLARILNVPPVQLLFPVGLEETTEVLPHKSVDTWAGLQWFTGEASHLPGDAPDAAPVEGAAAVRLFRRHDRLVAEWSNNNRQLQKLFTAAPGSPEANMVRLASQTLQSIGEALKEVREQIRRQGLKPPQLQADLAYVDVPETDITYTPLSEESDE
ncbi:helix-turn-helix transcriptional regulator [Streptomyces sp. NPDC002685]|uniref:helix-turn-helix domain-containing protein n=1 Tax=Streptomyces sp. NPDC002685 TaxID=3154540 RepID=UPI00332B5716